MKIQMPLILKWSDLLRSSYIFKNDGELQIQPALMTHNHCLMRLFSSKLLLLLIFLFLTSNKVSASQLFKNYPLANDYFEQIYLINDPNGIKYLTISCKERNTVSLAFTSSLIFDEAPVFDITGGQQRPPRMMTQNYTFLDECPVTVTINQQNQVELKRITSERSFFTIKDVSFTEGHNKLTVMDDSIKWGMGERFQNDFHIADGKWTIWNRDKPWKIDRGTDAVSDQTYGHQPVYLARERGTSSKLYHLAYFKNTYGMLFESKDNSRQIVINSMGGNPHFVIFIGDQNPESLLKTYHNYIGKAHIPPFWSMGFHQCRWGYQNFKVIEEVVNKYNQNGLPLDVVWNDLDYMNKKMIFTVDQAAYPPSKVNHLIKSQDLHYVPLIDVGVSVHDYVAMKLGKQMKVFVKNPVQNPNQEINYFVAEVWPGQVHFPDFLHPNITAFWTNQLARLYEKIQFSGIWLDMNEPTNFRGGEAVNEPFRIQKNENINTMTININLEHYSPNKKQKLLHKEVHAYYGHLSTVPTYKFLKQHGRPFIITRSNSVGTGRFAGHWTGDNVASWEFLRLSISGNFLYQIFGIQMVGSDICGFHEHTTEELCARWMQLGSFYPFARNHNDDLGRPQQPYAFGQSLLETSKISLKTRYALLKQLYTTLLLKKGVGSFFRPLFFQFYGDEKALESEVAQTQILIGSYLMVAPVVKHGAVDRQVYFPGSSQKWYEFKIQAESGRLQSKGQTRFYPAGMKTRVENHLPSAPPTFLRSGYALFTNTPQLRSKRLDNSFHILFALDSEDRSKGEILSIQDYNEEKYISKCIQENCVLSLEGKKQGQNLSLSWEYSGDLLIFSPLKVKSITVLKEGSRWKSTKQQFQVGSSKGSQVIPLVKQG